MLFLEGKHVPALQTQTMKNFAAIDFETANQCHSSVCSVGVVVVRDGKVTDKFYSLIYPHPYFFSYWNTRVHGLTLEDVADAPEFPDVWSQVETLIAVFEKYVMDYPEYEFYCTCRASRRKLKGVLPNHQLHTVAAYCGYDLTKHHNALADAEACAAIALELL